MASVRKRAITWLGDAGESRTSTKYEADYTDRSGHRHRRLFALKKDAKRWLDEQTAGLVTGQWADPRSARESVRSYGQRWLLRQVLADSTAAAYAAILTNHVFPTLGSMPIGVVQRADIQSLVKQWQQTAAASTVESRYSVMAILFRAAIKERVIAVTPCVDITLPPLPPKGALVPISTETVQAMRDQIADRYRLFVTLGAGTGMRRAEILGLSLDRISFDFATIRVDRQLSRFSRTGAILLSAPKTPASTRTIPAADVVIEAIRDHLETYGHHQSGLLLTTDLGNSVGASTLHHVWQIASRTVGTRATPHDLRHYFASIQIRGGQSIKVLQALLGHKSAVETWDTYGHLMGDEDNRSRAVVESALRAPSRPPTGTPARRPMSRPTHPDSPTRSENPWHSNGTVASLGY